MGAKGNDPSKQGEVACSRLALPSGRFSLKPPKSRLFSAKRLHGVLSTRRHPVWPVLYALPLSATCHAFCQSGVRWRPGQELPPLVLCLPVTLSGALFYASCVLLSRFASGPFQRCSLPGLVISRYGDFIRPISAPVNRILTDATVGSFWIGVSLCAVYLRLQAHVKGRLYRQPPAIFQGLASLF